jgi:ComF family protein
MGCRCQAFIEQKVNNRTINNQHIMNSILQLIRTIPSDCCLCEQPVSQLDNPEANKDLPAIICGDCHKHLPFLSHCCPICAMPLATGLAAQQLSPCGTCLKQAPFFSRCITAFHYEPPISQFISQLKFNAQFQYQNLLSYYLLTAIKQKYLSGHWPQALITVPLHPQKTKHRGFNQSLLLAKSLANQLSIKLLTQAIRRTRYTQAQTKLNAKQRHKNLKGAFSVSLDSNQYQHVALIDDVMTTGTTANEIAAQLIKAGVKQVDVWCVARAFAV